MQQESSKAHWSFWVINILFLIWNAMGALNFIMQLNPDNVANYRPTEQAIIVGRPLWATIGFAVAVFGGTLGSLLILLRKYLAFNFFAASLFGVIITMIHALGLDISFQAGEIIGFVALPLVVAVFLV